MRRVMGAALIATVAGQAGAADWRLAAESDRAVSFLDMASIHRDGDAVRFARWMVLKAAMASGADNLKDGFEANCGAGSYKVVAVEAFQHDRSAGSMPGVGGTAEPGTVMASLLDLACGRRKPDGAAVSDPHAAGRERLDGAAPQAKSVNS